MIVPDGKVERMFSIYFIATVKKIMGMKGYELRYVDSSPRRLKL